MLKTWDDLPEYMKNEYVKHYYSILMSKRCYLVSKRILDIVFAVLLTAIVGIPMIIIAVWIKHDSKGTVFYRQERVTQYGRVFKIHKFRTMVSNADQIGSLVTVDGDSRITNAGKTLRHYRLDELPQLFDIISGNMSFFFFIPEALKYVKQYRPEYYSTLLMPAGVTSETSVLYKDEDSLLDNASDPDYVYINEILPKKMEYNLLGLENLSLGHDFHVIKMTIKNVFFK